MAYGAYALNKIQLGREATPGTAVSATTIWRGEAVDIEDAREMAWPGEEENVGLLVPTARAYVAQLGAQLAFPETELTYEQILHILEAGIATVTPSGLGPYTYTYEWPTTATVNTIKTYTIETGNALAGDVNEMAYSFVEEFQLSGQYGEAWKMSATWRGRQAVASTFTAGLAVPAVEEALFGNTRLYLDNSGGTVGTTQITGVLTQADISVTTGIVPVPVGDGSLYFAAHKFVRPEVTVSLTLELENNTGVVAAERANYRNRAIRLLRLECPGTGGRTFRFDAAVMWESVDTYSEEDGDTVVTFNGKVLYSPTDALFGRFVVTNNLASVP